MTGILSALLALVAAFYIFGVIVGMIGAMVGETTKVCLKSFYAIPGSRRAMETVRRIVEAVRRILNAPIG